MVVKIITSKNFEEFVSQNRIAVIDFHANWCMPCRIVSPRIEELSNEIDNVAFGKINVDENADIAQRFGLVSIPTVVVFKEGKQIDEVVGTQPKDKISELIEKYI
jgi:thioredoxin